MIAVVIAGGSGTRLWPLSTETKPKHLLSLTDENSMLQNTCSRAAQVAEKIFVITEKSHSHIVAEQLPHFSQDQIVIEPARRGTASCILLGLSVLRKQGIDKHEPVVFMHADHLIRDINGFSESIAYAGEEAKASGKIVLLGVEPTYPATGFGYICKSKRSSAMSYYVEGFKEKPDAETAKKYVSSGRYLWNMGYFVATLQTFEDALQLHAPDLWKNYHELLAEKTPDAVYMNFESAPIDIALIEKTPDLLVVPGGFDWMDVGSFADLHGVAEQDALGNVAKGAVELEATGNSYVRNETEVPVAVIGLDNVIVINTPDGVLVANKNYSQKVGDVAKRLAAKK